MVRYAGLTKIYHYLNCLYRFSDLENVKSNKKFLKSKKKNEINKTTFLYLTCQNKKNKSAS